MGEEIINKLNALLERLGNESGEKTILRFIISACKMGVIESCRDDGNDYFAFKFANENSEYQLVFGKNPDDQHPMAERALRSSKFYMHLENVRSQKHNVFLNARCRIEAPSGSVVKTALGFDDNVRIGVGKKSRTGQQVQIADIFFVEIKTVFDYVKRDEQNRLRAGYEYVTTVDGLIVKRDGSGNLNYAHYSQTQNQDVTQNSTVEQTNLEIAVNEIEQERLYESRRQEIDLKKHKLENDKNEQRKIIQVLFSANRSQFSQKVREVFEKEYESVNIGEITIDFCGLIIGGIPETTFEYEVASNNENTKLNLTWNDVSANFTTDTPLYVETDKDGKFKGLTYAEKEINEDGTERNRAKIGDHFNLVFAKTVVENQIANCLSIVPKKPEHVKDFRINNYAVKACASTMRIVDEFGKGKISQEYCTNDSVETLGETTFEYSPNVKFKIKKYGSFHKCVCAEEAYTGQRAWLGDLTETDCKFLYKTQSTEDKPNGEIEERTGKLLKEFANKYKRTCCCCNKTSLYALDDVWEQYIKDKTLNDRWVCGECSRKAEEASKNNENLPVWENGSDKVGLRYVYDSSESNKYLYPIKLDENNNPFLVTIASDGTVGGTDKSDVYQCTHDGNLIIYNENEINRCPTCGGMIGSTCLKNIEEDEGFKLFNGYSKDLTKREERYSTICNNCKKLYNDRLKNVYLPNSEAQVKILVNNDESNVITCKSCGNEIYYGEEVESEFSECFICETVVENNCPRKGKDENNMADSRIEGLSLCKDCKEIEEVKEELNKLIAIQTDIDNLDKQIKSLKQKPTKDDLKQKVIENKGKYLKHLSLPDKIRAGKLKDAVIGTVVGVTTVESGTPLICFSMLPYKGCKYLYEFYKNGDEVKFKCRRKIVNQKTKRKLT